MIPLDCPLIVIDTETTGPYPKVDRVIQIGLVKIYPDGNQKEWSTYINPEMTIPPETIEIHHITDEMVKDAPKFAEIASILAAGLVGCDFAGYNVNFDLSFLEMEFAKVTNKKIINGRVVDAYRLWAQLNPRTLSDFVKALLGREHTGAHDALIDARETFFGLEKLLEKYPHLPQRVHDLDAMLNKIDERYVDSEGKFYWRYGEACINFSHQAGISLKNVDRGFLKWVLKNDFSDEVKQICRDALTGKYPEKPIVS